MPDMFDAKGATRLLRWGLAAAAVAVAVLILCLA